MTSQNPIIPLELTPTVTNNVSRMELTERSVEATAGTFSVTLNSVVKSLSILTNGKLFMTTHKDVDDSSGTPIPASPIHTIITKVKSGDYVLDFSAYRDRFTGTGPGVDNRVVTAHASATYPATFDGDQETDLGGFFFNFRTSYPVSDLLTENQIKNAFDSI